MLTGVAVAAVWFGSFESSKKRILKLPKITSIWLWLPWFTGVNQPSHRLRMVRFAALSTGPVNVCQCATSPVCPAKVRLPSSASSSTPGDLSFVSARSSKSQSTQKTAPSSASPPVEPA